MIEDLPKGVLGAVASGVVSAGDYTKLLVPAIDARVAAVPVKLRFLYQLGPEVKHIRPGAMWQDVRLRATHMLAFERIALVTDIGWVSRLIHTFGWVVPGEVKMFRNDQFDDAVTWLKP
jgi:hypothetical protein